MATSQNPNSAAALNLAELGASTSVAPQKKNETLFGPNIGIVSSGPKWTEQVGRKKEPVEEIGADIVKRWIARSKEPNQPTTTLQALVNLKRPTLRLTPLKPNPDDESPHNVLHALEFEYDADTPQCKINVSVVIPPEHRDAAAPENESLTAVVFENVSEGGFGRTLNLEHGAHLELAQYEHTTNKPPPAPPAAEDTANSSAALSPPARSEQRRSSRRFSFHLRRTRAAAAGPALAVVDAESAPKDTASGDKSSTDDDDEGVKIVIRLTALNDKGEALDSPNEQITYLHVVRFGSPPAEGEEEKRQWVVKVVKREAVIGAHVFHLHEIYGLSAHASTTPAPTSTLESHTYPPTGALPQQPQEDEPSSECLLCLSAPREVVLLPCRHLVACKDCAMNMIEFGAGGTIHQPEETDAATPDGEAEGATEGNDGAANATPEATPTTTPATTPAAAAPVPVPPRRKRKAKGWFCPVCRQPYTSLLRITTTPPDKEDAEATTEAPAAAANAELSSPAAAGGPLSNLPRPGFLRALSLGRSGPQQDVERGA